MRSLSVKLLLGLTLPLYLSLLGLKAQDYSVDQHKVAAGGGISSAGSYSVAGTIGQLDAGVTVSGAGYSLAGGFWSLTTIVPSLGAPTLFIKYSDNGVTIYWGAQPGWVLQQN